MTAILEESLSSLFKQEGKHHICITFEAYTAKITPLFKPFDLGDCSPIASDV